MEAEKEKENKISVRSYQRYYFLPLQNKEKEFWNSQRGFFKFDTHTST